MVISRTCAVVGQMLNDRVDHLEDDGPLEGPLGVVGLGGELVVGLGGAPDAGDVVVTVCSVGVEVCDGRDVAVIAEAGSRSERVLPFSHSGVVVEDPLSNHGARTRPSSSKASKTLELASAAQRDSSPSGSSWRALQGTMPCQYVVSLSALVACLEAAVLKRLQRLS